MFDSPDGGATFRFKKTVTAKAVRAAGSAPLSELFRRARRYDGKGCLNAVDNVAGHIAPLFVGKTLSELGSLVDVDRALLAAECALAAKRGKLSARATPDQRIAAAQRKANLGMNAILPTSLALGRLIAARDAVELPDILRAMQNNLDRAALYGVK